MTLTEIIVARLIEFAYVMRHQEVRGLKPADDRCVWQFEVTHTAADINGRKFAGQRGQAADEWQKARNRTRVMPSSVEIQRADETQDWLLRAPMKDVHRAAVQNWSAARAAGHSFTRWCKENGRERKTELARVDRAVDLISDYLRRKGHFPTVPERKSLFPKSRKIASVPATVRDERPVPDIPEDRRPKSEPLPPLGTPERTLLDIAMIAAHNAEMRKRKRRAEKRREKAA